VSQPVQPPAAYASPADAVAAVQGGLGFLAGADAASLPVPVLADCLRDLESVLAVHTAARSRVLAAFTAQSGFEDDGSRSPVAWLAWQARTTRGAAAAAVAWMRRLGAHPRIGTALAAGQVSESCARKIFDWSARLPEAHRDDADRILLAAHAGGADLADLAGLAEEMFRRCAPPDTGGDREKKRFGDRSVTLDLHFRGEGSLAGHLTPECAATVLAALDAMSRQAGPADDRTLGQRQHDAVEEAFRRVIAAGDLPGTGGQPTQVLLHMPLDYLHPRDTTGTAGDAGNAGDGGGAGDAVAAWWAARAAADGQPGWVSSRQAARAYACDAQIQPVVTGHVDRAVLAAMTDSYLAWPGRPVCTCGGCTCRPAGPAGSGADGALSPETMRRLQDTLLKYAADVLSGPAGLASFLRAGLPADEFPPVVSLPLDVGASAPTVPPHLRRAVMIRDRHCVAAGCRQRRGHVHHVKPRSEGGTTSLDNLVFFLCPFHQCAARRCCFRMGVGDPRCPVVAAAG
jgi:Domain of unknown function (DUF222)